ALGAPSGARDPSPHRLRPRAGEGCTAHGAARDRGAPTPRICESLPEQLRAMPKDLNATGRWLKRLTQGLAPELHDREDLLAVLREAGERGIIDGDALTMLEGVLEVGDLQVRDIMVPRAQMVFVRRDQGAARILPVVVESGHSRFPVMDADRDDIVGILLAKDLLRLTTASARERFDIREYMRPAVFVPESKRLNVLLKEFRRNRNHMAIVVDEYGGVSGLCTIEDVIEQIVGEIDDEFDVEDDQNIRRDAERHFTVRGVTRISEFNEYFGARRWRSPREPRSRPPSRRSISGRWRSSLRRRSCGCGRTPGRAKPRGWDFSSARRPLPPAPTGSTSASTSTAGRRCGSPSCSWWGWSRSWASIRRRSGTRWRAGSPSAGRCGRSRRCRPRGSWSSGGAAGSSPASRGSRSGTRRPTPGSAPSRRSSASTGSAHCCSSARVRCSSSPPEGPAPGSRRRCCCLRRGRRGRRSTGTPGRVLREAR